MMVTTAYSSYGSSYAPARKDAFPFTRKAGVRAPARFTPRTHQLEVAFEDFRDVAVFALQDIIALLRVAKWKDEYNRGYATDWPERVPHFSHTRLTPQLHANLTALIDATFDAPSLHTLRSLAHSVVNWLLAPTLPPTVSAVVWALDDAARLCAKGFTAFNAPRDAPFVAPSFSLADSPLHTPPDNSAPALELELVNDALRAEERRYAGLGDVGRPAATQSTFIFSVGPHPGKLFVSWPAEFGESFYDATKAVAGKLKEESRTPSYMDFVAFHMGSHLPGTREMSFPTTGADIVEWI